MMKEKEKGYSALLDSEEKDYTQIEDELNEDIYENPEDIVEIACETMRETELDKYNEDYWDDEEQ